MSIDPVLLGPINPDTLLPPEGTVDALRRAILDPHVEDETPHPSYDDIPDLTVLYRNRKAQA